MRRLEARAARRCVARANSDVAIRMDTDSQRPQVLVLSGRADVTEVDGVAPEYALFARQYMGDEAFYAESAMAAAATS